MAKKNRHKGHYCRICGETKSNESFDGKGHARHICRKCYALPLEEREEMGRMENLVRVTMKFPMSHTDWGIVERYATSHKEKESGQYALTFLEDHSRHYRSKIAAKKKKQNNINKIKSRKGMKDLLEIY